MGITFESICKKLGFNPITDKYDYKTSGYEDDSKTSPFSVLSLEESDFLCDYMKANYKKATA